MDTAREEKPNRLGNFIREKREELGLSRNALAVAAGISHTELRRIEAGERKEPSGSTLISLASAMGIPEEKMLEVAGILPSYAQKYPELKTEKQRDTISEIARGLARNSDSLKDEDLDDLLKQVDMFIAYAKNKNNSK
ncbi:helix-turn-helix transcriptional regulator [uncultured Dialister sp.]|uniref:helix-turn-helix domain-containing protein n=1 Tax=Dialister succinatiphilus TaxID=487173 RepID=UPI00266EE01A|nr:transcriptional regulator [uncultured Dialister sp.]